MISNPEAVEALQNYNMWQAFLTHATMRLGEHKISAYTIMHSILRYALDHPKFGKFVLETPSIEF